MPNTNISRNTFYMFLTDYTKYVEHVKHMVDNIDLYQRNIKKKRSWLTKTASKFIIPDMNNDQKNLKIATESINHELADSSIDTWLFSVKEFIEFLDFAELACLFKNDKIEQNIHVDCDHKHSSYVLYYYDEAYETEYRLSFLDTEIPNLDYKPLESFISDSGSKYMTLIQLDILRNYGEKRCNQIKLVGNNNESILKNSSDLYIFNIIKSRLTQVILQTLFDILGNVNESYKFDKNIVHEVLDGYITIQD